MKSITILFLAVSLATAAENANDLFQKALLQERSEGNLREAIKLYQRIVDKHAGNRKLAAQALLQLADCHAKLGDTEVRKSLERLVRDFSDQQEAVTIARARLAALGGTKAAEGMSLRHVDTGGRFAALGGVSADGRLLAFSDWGPGGIQALYDTATRQVKVPIHPNWDGPDYGTSNVLSRDGKWVAFGTYKYAATDAELRVVRTDGTGMRAIYKMQGKSWIEPQDWTPDNLQVLARIRQRANQGTTHLCLVKVADGSIRRLREGPTNRAWISPDGSYVLYGAGGKGHMLALDGSLDEVLLPKEATSRPIGWTPDGKGVLILSQRSGERGLWLAPVENGRAAGELRLLRAGMPGEIEPAGLTSDGKLYFSEPSQVSNGFLVFLEGASGPMGKPERITPLFEGKNGYAAWSPDGARLAWFGLKGGLGGALLQLRDLATNREKATTFPAPASGDHTPRWLADNRTIVYEDRITNAYRRTLLRFDTETGETRPLAEDVPSHAYDLTKDGVKLYYVKEGYATIMVRDTQTQAEREVGSVDGRAFTIALSPDEKSIACRVATKIVNGQPLPGENTLVILDVATGHSRVLAKLDRRAVGRVHFFRRSLTWTPDSQTVLVTAHRNEDAKGAIWAFPAAGGAPKLLLEAEGFLADTAVSPDGKKLSYTEQRSQWDLWVLENFLPALRAGS